MHVLQYFLLFISFSSVVQFYLDIGRVTQEGLHAMSPVQMLKEPCSIWTSSPVSQSREFMDSLGRMDTWVRNLRSQKLQ